MSLDTPFSFRTRVAALQSMAAEPVDVLVIGGGITGAGIARDAALRGCRTALVDRGDFGGGTSSHSSRLVHGGRTTQLWDATVSDPDGRPMALFRCTQLVLRAS